MVDSVKARQQIGRRLGKQIADRRSSIEWTQSQLAERVGVDAETISRFERGVTLPSIPTLEKLAKILKTRAADLLSDSSIEPSDQSIRISAWLLGLTQKDSEFVLEQVKRLCDHLRRKGA